MRQRRGQRDQIIKSDGGRQQGKHPDAGHRIVAEILEQAADVHHVRLEARQKCFANAFGDLPTQRVAGIDPDRPGSEPDADIVLRQEQIKRSTNGFDCVRKQTAEHEQHFVVGAICDNGLGERLRIAPDTAKSARGLRTLEI